MLRGIRRKKTPAAREAVEVYLARIERDTRRLRFSYRIAGTIRAGYDSNVNSATEATEFLGFTLNETSREQDSDFFEGRVHASAAYRLSERLRLDGRLSISPTSVLRASPMIWVSMCCCIVG